MTKLKRSVWPCRISKRHAFKRAFGTNSARLKVVRATGRVGATLQNSGCYGFRSMSLYRNRYFLAGILLVLLGLQFRRVESFVLNERSTRFMARVTNTKMVDNSTTVGAIIEPVAPVPRKRVTPPPWVGLSMIAVGCVMAFHAFVIPKHNG